MERLTNFMPVTTRLLWLFAVLLTSLNAAEPPARDFGQIKAVHVIGDVTVAADDSEDETALCNGDLLFEGCLVRTGAQSSVVLVFSNGASVRLMPNTQVAVDMFRQDPLGGDIDAGSLVAEPSASETALHIAYGELVGDVHKLNTSTSYSISTAVGSAGIRGTQFRLVDRELDNGSQQFALNTNEGLVRLTDPAGEKNVDVPAGRELTYNVKSDATFPWKRAKPHAIGARAQKLIVHNAQIIRDGAKRVKFSRADGKAGPGKKPKIRRAAKREKDKDDDLKEFAKDDPEWKRESPNRSQPPRRKRG